jgi:RNA polymerase sigma-70 factor (ECF subfamily)
VTEAEFRDAFRSNKDVLYRFAYRMTGADSAAQDIVQDCFVALWERRGYDRGLGTARAYLLGIARNLALKRWRRESRFEPEQLDAGVCGPIDVVGMERAEAVAAAVRALPPLQREAIVLVEYEEMTLDEISRITHTDLAAVKSRLYRARQNLRRMLTPLIGSERTFYGTQK